MEGVASIWNDGGGGGAGGSADRVEEARGGGEGGRYDHYYRWVIAPLVASIFAASWPPPDACESTAGSTLKDVIPTGAKEGRNTVRRERAKSVLNDAG